MSDLDAFDLKILAALQRQGDLSHVQLATLVHLSATQCARRLQRLRAEGHIRRVVAILDPARMGVGVMAHTMVGLRSHDAAANAAFRDFVSRADEVVECWSQTGDADFLMKILVRDLAHLSDVLDRLIAVTGGLASLRSSIVLKELKATTEIPLFAHPSVARP